MSLADELLADLEDDDHEDNFMETAEIKTEVENEIGNMEEEIKGVSLKQLAKLRSSERLQTILTEMDHYQKMMNDKSSIVGPLEADPEYQLIVEANNLAADIDSEIVIIHRFVRDKYSKRFPELESLVVQPLEYMMSVRELGNDLDQAKNNETLQQYLTQATIMVVSVTASTTQGQILNEQELQEIQEACDMAAELNTFKLRIYEYVESRMTFIAPNVTAIVGASTAAKILGVAGGLSKLSKMPACNVLMLGSQKQTLSGFSQTASLPHTGFIYYATIVQDTPPDLRRKAARLVASKTTLASRVDAAHEAKRGEVGIKFREEIEKKIDKLTEPPPVKFVKPLPKPIDPGRKKRGGKHVRKLKERYAMTELRKQNNRMNFADIEDDAYQEDLGYTRGTIGKTGTGRVRLPQVDEKTKVRISKTLQKNLQKQQHVWGGSTTVKKQVSGTASSVAFTPLQGLEIVNPQAAEKNVGESDAKYFSNTAGFVNLQKN
ncbi:U4/U6 small nuclear ribonucleoprotein Prp31 isoform X1 [Nilaparvata lugens]|uniref:U4/U6 small nuclear ribonucleoprotein Prp31 isoform X1 n=2 Tax=Nilaparvata lugens TaxID=108931 RepID=UPI00193D795F|nr:U4/U6 small nuclear ribonucleoprotein Prp31 isoform X1 [Nilaparvata lugens]XP_039292903.1 U4/U6 small nuclear ribonucleoprotein Prp31 isoform X1 [Nilaparvata lugens]